MALVDVDVVVVVGVYRLQPVSEWTTANVLEWMASVNMLSYSGPFESTAIQGSDLPGLDRHKLAGMGIKEDYPQQAILVCISKLCRSRGIVSIECDLSRPTVSIGSSSLFQRSCRSSVLCSFCARSPDAVLFVRSSALSTVLLR